LQLHGKMLAWIAGTKGEGTLGEAIKWEENGGTGSPISPYFFAPLPRPHLRPLCRLGKMSAWLAGILQWWDPSKWG